MTADGWPPFPELGFYALAGHIESPRQMLDELRTAEEMGLGSAFLSVRLNVKEAASLSGAAAAVTERMGIVTAATNQTLRHPVVTAAWATTVHRLSGGRFTLGLGRGLSRGCSMRWARSGSRPPSSRTSLP